MGTDGKIVLNRNTQVAIMGYEMGWEAYSFECITTLENSVMEILKRNEELGSKAIYEIKLHDCMGSRLATVCDTMVFDDFDYGIEEGYTFERIVTQDGKYKIEIEERKFSVETYLEDANASLEQKINFLKAYREQMLKDRENQQN